CEEEHCGCGHSSPLASALKHTVSIFAVIVAVTLVLNGIIEAVGLEGIKNAVGNAGILAPLFAAAVGLIPNCAASVVITELYMAQAISFGTAVAGLLAGSGIAWVVLFRMNRNRKENLKILSIVYTVSVVSGMVLNGMNIAF
ncbi:MAG: arsenic efflux protein, partial [Oscillospiraceae bacterium]|nr:arsenic efflux protein [Oscillospiraceae bacterium]